MTTNEKYLIEMFEFMIYKIKHNKCTNEDIDNATRFCKSDMNLSATIGDLADFYDKSKDAVNSVIKNKLLAKPKRNVVLYPFQQFREVIPDSWRKKHTKIDD